MPPAQVSGCQDTSAAPRSVATATFTPSDTTNMRVPKRTMRDLLAIQQAQPVGAVFGAQPTGDRTYSVFNEAVTS